MGQLFQKIDLEVQKVKTEEFLLLMKPDPSEILHALKSLTR